MPTPRWRPGTSAGFRPAPPPRHRWWPVELDRRYRDWDARGRPAVGDYQVSFLPIGTECDAPAGGWQIERRFYRELVTLSPAQSRP
jgi:hypothetical protein